MSNYSNDADFNKSFLREGVVSVNYLPTHVMTCGEWLHEKNPADESMGPIIIVFPGNPGVITFYKDFMCALYENLGRSIPIWGVSYVGHSSLKSGDILPAISGNESVYDLEGQVIHKMGFIKTFAPKGRKLILIGHSIGCYLIIELMKRCQDVKVEHAYLLFPTIERMSSTPKGQSTSLALKYLHFPALLVVYLFGLLNESVQRKIISWFIGSNDIPECTVAALLSFCKPSCVRASFLMARDELKNVSEFDRTTIGNNIEKLTFYYGSADQWCPVTYYEGMKDTFPQGDIQLCTRNMKHAFVLESSVEMANIMGKWITKGSRTSL